MGRDVRYEKVEYYGGPLDGQTRPWTSATRVVIPDGSDYRMVMRSDDTVGMVFGQHTYEMRLWIKGDKRRYRLDYVGYEPPRAGK